MPTTQDTLNTGTPRARIVPGGLKANLATNREETLRWVEEAPLRLVAAVLLDAPRRQAKVGDLEEALAAVVMESTGRKWQGWWDAVRPGLQASRQFSYPKGKPIRLRASNLADMDSRLDELRASTRVSMSGADKPSESAAPAPSATAAVDAAKARQEAGPTPDIAGLGGWVLWVQADEDEEQPMPKSVPSTQFATFLGRQPKALASRAVSRVASGIQQRVVESNNPSDKTIESWQESLVAALNRLSGVADQQDAALKEAVLITARVLEKHIRPEFQDLVEWMAAFTSGSDGSAKIMSDAILSASRIAPLGTNHLLGRLSKLLDAPVRKDLWLGLMQSSLSQRRAAGLFQHWLGMLKAEERADAITYLFRVVEGGESIKVMDSLLRTEWEKSSVRQRERLSDAVALSWQSQLREPSENSFALNSAKPTAQMGAWLKVLDLSERYDVISHLIRVGGDAGMIQAIGSVLETEWKVADDDQRHRLFDAVVTGWALHEGLRPDARAVMLKALLDLNGSGAPPQDSRLSELTEMVREAARAEVEQVRSDLNRQLEEKDQEKEEVRTELDRTKNELKFLQGKNRHDRQSAELEVTRKAIEVLGIVLQELATSPSSKLEEISDVESRIILALSTLGVKPIGEIGKIVEYDSKLHQADSPQSQGTMVKVIAPGMQYARRNDSPLNLVKMKVKA